MNCEYCGKELNSKGLSHKKFCKKNPNRLDRSGSNNPHYSKKGHNHYTYGAEMSDETKKKMFETRTKNGTRWHTKESKEKISKKLSINNKGGRCKWYDVTKPDGTVVKVQGTWESRFALILNIIDPDWIKPTKTIHSFEWVDADEKCHYYTPDFYSPANKKYFEIKGHWWGNDKDKMQRVLSQNDINIEIIQENELKEYENKILGTVADQVIAPD